MNLKFEQFSVGDAISFEKKFQLEDFKKFAEISGDLNPLHHDAEYAAVYGNKQTIVPLHLIVGSNIVDLNAFNLFSFPWYIHTELEEKGN